jgi:hypothetical protein
MKFNFSQIKLIDSPYPHVIIENFLEGSDLDSLLSEFPKNTSNFQNVMGGRARLASDEAEFYEFIGGNKVWQNFYSALNNKAFVKNVIDIFSDKISDYNPVYDFEDFAFDCDFLEKRAFSDFLRNSGKHQIHKVASKDLLKIVFFRVIKKITNLMRINDFRSRNELYLHLDISEASIGYGREIHHDNDNRLAAMVFYLTDQGDMQGGEFGIHEYIENTPLDRCVPHPNDSEMKLSSLITPQKNTLVLFLSTPNSYHSVPVIKSLKNTRKFIYAGISCKCSNVWENVVPNRQ